MNEIETRQDNELIDRLDVLRNAPARDPMRAASGRERFLEQARGLSQRKEALHAVSIQPALRHKGWITQIHSLSKRKERYSMFALVTTVSVLVALVLGGGGATVYASQTSLPDQVLYPLKTASEDVRLSLAGDPQARLDLLLDFTDRRIAELVALQAAGEPASEETAQRLQAEYSMALQLAAGMEEGSVQASRERIRSRLRDQDRVMEMSQKQIRSTTDPIREQVRAMIRRHLAELEGGAQDPEAIRQQLRYEYRWERQAPQPPASQTPPGTGSSFGPGPGADLGTPSCGECTPVQDGSGPGPGPGPIQNGGTPEPPGGPGPQGEVTPGSGQGGGSGQPADPGGSHNPDAGGGGQQGHP